MEKSNIDMTTNRMQVIIMLKYKLVLFQEGEIVGGHQSVLSLCQPQMFSKLLGLLPASGLSSTDMLTIFLPDWQHHFVSSFRLSLSIFI